MATCPRVLLIGTAIVFAALNAYPEDTADPTVESEETMNSTLPTDTITAPLMEFDQGTPKWRRINDVVMGGRSSSQFRVEEGLAVFEGNLSLENNGGFASVRSKPDEYDLSEKDGILLRVRGDGKRYAFRIRTTKAFDGVTYQARFNTLKDAWGTVAIPFEKFKPVFRGRIVPGAKPLDLKSIKTFGILISDKQAGEFHLEVDFIRVYTLEKEKAPQE